MIYLSEETPASNGRLSEDESESPKEATKCSANGPSKKNTAPQSPKNNSSSVPPPKNNSSSVPPPKKNSSTEQPPQNDKKVIINSTPSSEKPSCPQRSSQHNRGTLISGSND